MTTQTLERPTSATQTAVAMAPWDQVVPGAALAPQAIAHRLEAMGAMSPRELQAATAALLDFESGLPNDQLRPFFVAKLKAYTTVEPATAARVMEELDTFLRLRPAEMLMRRQVAIQGASRELTLHEITHLEALLPNIRELAGLPPRKYAPELSMAGPEPKPAGKRPFWRAFLRT